MQISADSTSIFSLKFFFITPSPVGRAGAIREFKESDSPNSDSFAILLKFSNLNAAITT